MAEPCLVTDQTERRQIERGTECCCKSCHDRLVGRRPFYRQHNSAGSEGRHGPLFHPPHHGIVVLPVETDVSASHAEDAGDRMLDVACTADSEGIIPRGRTNRKGSDITRKGQHPDCRSDRHAGVQRIECAPLQPQDFVNLVAVHARANTNRVMSIVLRCSGPERRLYRRLQIALELALLCANCLDPPGTEYRIPLVRPRSYRGTGLFP